LNTGSPERNLAVVQIVSELVCETENDCGGDSGPKSTRGSSFCLYFAGFLHGFSLAISQTTQNNRTSSEEPPSNSDWSVRAPSFRTRRRSPSPPPDDPRSGLLDGIHDVRQVWSLSATGKLAPLTENEVVEPAGI
jgi:hypothetical protein